MIEYRNSATTFCALETRKKSFHIQKKFIQDVWRSCLSVEEERFNTSLSSSTSPPPQACPALARYQSSVRIENPTLSPILNYGKYDGIKMVVFSEKFQTAFDPTPSLIFGKSYWVVSFKFHAQNAMFKGPRSAI